jgi:hypothetical protein
MKHNPAGLFSALLSHDMRERIERVVLVIAIASFLIHLLLIGLVSVGAVNVDPSMLLLGNPISALYTPFSFILVYEVYLLIYYLPKSLTTYINKQYEIILLIIMRRLFKDLADLEITSDWFALKYDLQFTYDLITTLLLFFLIYLFSTYSIRRASTRDLHIHVSGGTRTYARIKRLIASGLVPVVFILATYTLVEWLTKTIYSVDMSSATFHSVNRVFFQEFFTVLVLVDVLLLLVSFFYSDKFHVIIRNSGFIISTILIRLSFNVDGIMNNILVVAAVLFGLIIQLIFNMYEQRYSQEGDAG